MYKKFIKRILDLLFAIISLPVLLIVIIVLGPIIFIEDRGPIFYNAQRLGKDGKIFVMYKLRSMRCNCLDIRNKDGSTLCDKKDDRLTNIGRFLRWTSIDEMPQLINIIIGDMSFVGPRPDLPDHYKMYKDNEFKKLSVKPGITGFNQAYYRNSIPWKQRILNDIYYIDNLSLILDVKIFLKTIISVLVHKGI